MKIDHDSPIPLHFQVEQLLRDMLKEARYREGELLPPEAKMAEQLAVSRNTVRAAISRLVQEGCLERKAGLGTRHVKQAIKSNLSGWPSFSREMKQKGVTVEVFSLSSEMVRPDASVMARLRLKGSPSEEHIVKMSRVRGYGGVPAVYSQSWFHPRTKLTASENFARPLYDLIHEASGISVVYSKENISAVVADDDLAELLHCQHGDPILVRERVVKTAAKQEVEYNINYYRADRFTYGLTLQAS
ncbi:MAG: GntR family transcriptional regulator [Akkermansiaceae bacterium]|nr:GntR family transcriptional regulator [Akkermansiaceae bacterium]